MAVLYWSDVRPVQISSKQKTIGEMLGIQKIWPLAEADIALMYLDMKVFAKTKGLIWMPMSSISPGIPAPGALCFGFGYHSSEWKPDHRDGQWMIEVYNTFSASKGNITEVFFPMRDRGFLSFPCFETSSRYDFGMSGGPIFNEHGGVIGVIAGGLETERGYGSMIGSTLFIELDVGDDAGDSAKKFLYEYPGVKFDDTIRGLRIQKTARDVSIDFGAGRLLRLRRRLVT